MIFEGSPEGFTDEVRKMSEFPCGASGGFVYHEIEGCSLEQEVCPVEPVVLCQQSPVLSAPVENLHEAESILGSFKRHRFGHDGPSLWVYSSSPSQVM